MSSAKHALLYSNNLLTLKVKGLFLLTGSLVSSMQWRPVALNRGRVWLEGVGAD